MLAALKGLQWAIVDEVHELVANERGAHLSISLERLQVISSQPVTRIGLSATVGNLKQAAQFICGAGRRSAIVIDPASRSYDIDVRFVKGSLNNVAHFVTEYVKSTTARFQRRCAKRQSIHSGLAWQVLLSAQARLSWVLTLVQ